jgi:hypothetical protein
MIAALFIVALVAGIGGRAVVPHRQGHQPAATQPTTSATSARA